MAGKLERRRTVLTRSHEQLGHVVFGNRDEEEGTVLEVLYIPIETVQDLGSPDELTITIEPGNTLDS